MSVVSRVMLGNEQLSDFQKENIDVKLYSDRKFMFEDSIIITPESIPMIANYDFSNYIIFLDEFNSIIEHVLQSTTMKNNRIITLRVLVTMIRGCKQFIAVDADISAIATKFLDLTSIKYKFIENKFLHFKDTPTQIYSSEQLFMQNLKSEQSYLLCCDS